MSQANGKRSHNFGTNLGADYSDEEREFLAAMDLYKRNHHRPFPSWLEVFEVFKGLGYVKTPQVSRAVLSDATDTGG